MSMNITVTCDSCGEDITSSLNIDKYRIKLTSEQLPITGSTVKAVLRYPEIDAEKHFCNLVCLKTWLDKRLS